jgi:hypothetical protein
MKENLMYMAKIMTIVFSVLFFSVISAAEKNSSADAQKSKNISRTYEVVPGIGIEEIRIGNDYEFVVKVMGEYKTKTNYYDEEKIWKDYGYDVSVHLPFNIGFDYLIEYDESKNKTEYPIWKIYFKNNKVVYLVLSSYIYKKIETYSVGVSPQCYFGGEKAGMINTLGIDYFEFIDESGNYNMYYLKKGLVVILVGNKIKTMALFEPLTDSEKIEYLSKYPKK